MSDRVLLGYSGSWAFGLSSFHEIKRLKERLKKNPKNKKLKDAIKRLEKARREHGTPVYISKEKHKKLKKWKELEHYSAWL